jgi:hypothetical protein
LPPQKDWEANEPASDAGDTFEGRDRGTGELRWTGSRGDLVFGSNSGALAVLLSTAYLCVTVYLRHGLVWATKILTDPFHDVYIYWM